MGIALEVVSGRVVNPGATITALTADSNDSFVVRNFSDGNNAWTISAWASSATAGILRIRSPRWHDNVQGFRARVLAATTTPLWHLGAKQKLYAQDALIVEQSGGGAESDCASYLNFYENLPGADGRFFTWDQIVGRIKNVLAIETTHATGAVLGDYSGGVAINNNFDLLKANTDYAILGAYTDVQVCTIGYRGPDTGNIRAGVPATTNRIENREWFKELSKATGLPTIPVFNSANKGGTIVDLVHTTNAVTVNVTTLVAELGS